MIRARGFSLIELLITLAILGILLAVGASGFRMWIANMRIRTSAEAIQNGLQLARGEAVRRNAQIGFHLTDSITAGCALSMTDSNWVVSYDNPAGACDALPLNELYLYVLNAATGVQVTGLSPLATGVGDTASPSGLANIAAMVVDPQADNTIVAVYGGDLNGDLWRFDVNDTVGAAGVEAQLLAVLKDASGKRQPITTKPSLTFVKGQKVVFVGTGRFLDTSDSADPSQQSFYAIKDPWTLGGSAATAIFDNPGADRSAPLKNANGFVPQVFSWTTCPASAPASVCSPSTQVMTSTNNPVDFSTDNGWFVDLINPSERANTNPALGLGVVALVTNAPTLLACDIGGKSYLYILNYLSGGPTSPDGIVGDLISDSFSGGASIVETATGQPVVLYRPEKACTGPECIPCELNALGECTTPTRGPPPVLGTRRTSWRELISE